MDFKIEDALKHKAFATLGQEQKQKLLMRIKGKEQSFICAITQEGLSPEQQSDMLCLLQNMLLGDISCIDGPWLRQHVVDSRKILEMLPWGANLNPEIYRQFILPFRVNNEDVDYQRMEFFSRLWPRIQNMTMAEAALSINMYCYEEVRYEATDIRTVGPKNLLKRGLGRCGEQATLLIALLRSVAIPARQCYISRWSHTESNHAWVEAFTGDAWHYLGACEPEAQLDRGWFSEGLQRAILVQTRVADENYSLEPVISRVNGYSLVNLTERYTESVRVQVEATLAGQPIAAQAQISVMNGGEFFPMHTFALGQDGKSECFSLGRGDILLELEYSANGKVYDYWQILKIGNGLENGDLHRIACELAENSSPQHSSFRFEPRKAPKHSSFLEQDSPSEEQQKIFDTQMKAGKLAYQAKLQSFQNECFSERTLELFPDLEGRHEELKSYYKGLASAAEETYKSFEQLYPRFGEDFFRLLQVISYKERCFISCFAAADFLQQALRYKYKYAADLETWENYILKPKVDFELLNAHRQQIFHQLCSETGKEEMSPQEIFHWVKENVQDEPGHSFFYYRSAQAPLHSFRLRRADSLSRKVLLVALLRIFGHPARLNPNILAVEWQEGAQWQRESQPSPALSSAKQKQDSAYLSLEAYEQLPQDSQVSLALKKPEGIGYRSLFAGSAHDEEGQHGESGSMQSLLQAPLPSGQYRLCYSLRDESGNVDGWVQHFELADGQKLSIRLSEISQNPEWQVLGQLQANLTKDSARDFQVYVTTSKIDEPFYHFIHDMSESSSLCANVELYLPQQEDLVSYMQRFPRFQQLQFLDSQSESAFETSAANIGDWAEASFPKLLFCNRRGEILYMSCGYSRTAITQLSRALDYFKQR